MRACKPLPFGQLTTALVPTVPSPCFLRQSTALQSPRLEKHFCFSFVLIRFVIGELLSEVSSRVGHGLVLVWFESYVLRLVFLDGSLESPGQEKRLGILFIPFRVIFVLNIMEKSSSLFPFYFTPRLQAQLVDIHDVPECTIA